MSGGGEGGFSIPAIAILTGIASVVALAGIWAGRVLYIARRGKS